MPIYDKNDNVLTPAVASALSRPDVIEIKNRLLDGSYHVQSIGTAGTLLDVTAHFTMAEKLAFDIIKRNMSSIRVTFDGRYYTGVIDGELSWERLINTWDPMFTASFALMVDEEGVV